MVRPDLLPVTVRLISRFRERSEEHLNSSHSQISYAVFCLKKKTKKRREAAPAGEDKKQEAYDVVLETLNALIAERGAEEKIWGSMVKQSLKPRKSGFNESYYGFRAFSDLLEEMQQKALIKLDPDEKSGGYLIRPA